jgi:hypothetical protein
MSVTYGFNDAAKVGQLLHGGRVTCTHSSQKLRAMPGVVAGRVATNHQLPAAA